MTQLVHPAAFMTGAQLRFPHAPRELLQLLSLCGGVDRLGLLLDRVDMANATVAQIYRIAHRRDPEWLTSPEAEAAAPQPAMSDQVSPRALLEAAVLSKEFQNNILRHLLDAFPDLAREVFINIPGCAGSSFIRALAATRHSLSRELEDPDSTSKDMLLHALAGFVQLAGHVDTVFVYGNEPLGDHLARVGLRPGDHVLTVIREPVARMVSAANEAVGRLVEDPLGTAPATRDLLALLELDRLRPDATTGDLAELALRALRDPRICPPNVICRYLCDDAQTTYADADHHKALASIARHDIDISTNVVCGDWLRDQWGIEGGGTRRTGTDPYLSRAQALEACGDALRAAVAEDLLLYDLVASALRQSGASHVRGSALTQPATVPVVQDAPRGAPLGGIVVAEGERAVTLHMRGWPTASGEVPLLAGSASGLDAVFGIEGNAATVIRDGWSGLEPGYVWGLGPRSTLVLPRPAEAPYHALEIELVPFVHAERLPFQRLGLRINGTPVEPLRIADHAVVAVDVPWAVLAGRDDIEIEIEFPDAARPVEISDSGDDRKLGCSLRRLMLMPLSPLSVVSAPPPHSAEAPPPPDLPREKLMLCFESIGENCEFGLVQRGCGAEPLGLLRFASAPLPKLLAALRARFAGMGNPENVVVEVSSNEQEYMIDDRAFGFNYHAWVNVGEKTPAEIHAREVRRVPFLIRKLIEDLNAGEKIFVYHGMQPLSVANARNLAAALRAYGPGTLLWVELADAGHSAGSVEWVEAGLLCGRIDRFAPSEDAHDLSLESWITVCERAFAMNAAA
jgi:hypothetical protein